MHRTGLWTVYRTMGCTSLLLMMCLAVFCRGDLSLSILKATLVNTLYMCFIWSAHRKYTCFMYAYALLSPHSQSCCCKDTKYFLALDNYLYPIHITASSLPENQLFYDILKIDRKLHGCYTECRNITVE